MSPFIVSFLSVYQIRGNEVKIGTQNRLLLQLLPNNSLSKGYAFIIDESLFSFWQLYPALTGSKTPTD